VVVEGWALLVKGSDLKLDAAGRRDPANTAPYRRALVHDENDLLTLNFAGDYSSVKIGSSALVDGSVSIHGNLLVNQVILRRPGEEDVFLDLSAVNALAAGELSVKHLEVQDFEPDPVPPVGGGGMVSIDLAEELHRLRAALKAVTERLRALDGK
jgi:hypothetical protein